MGILLYGENSWSVLYQLEKKKMSLNAKELELKSQNQQLQKKFFELKQQGPKEV
jgi:chaperonin cofactor prefoldin